MRRTVPGERRDDHVGVAAITFVFEAVDAAAPAAQDDVVEGGEARDLAALSAGVLATRPEVAAVLVRGRAARSPALEAKRVGEWAHGQSIAGTADVDGPGPLDISGLDASDLPTRHSGPPRRRWFARATARTAADEVRGLAGRSL